MKAITVLLLTVSLTANAGDKEHFCDLVRQAGEVIAEAKQEGVSRTQVTTVMYDSQMPAKAQDMVEAMIRVIYETDVSAISPRMVGIVYEDRCLEALYE